LFVELISLHNLLTPRLNGTTNILSGVAQVLSDLTVQLEIGLSLDEAIF
jgi:hypothetical protein